MLGRIKSACSASAKSFNHDLGRLQPAPRRLVPPLHLDPEAMTRKCAEFPALSPKSASGLRIRECVADDAVSCEPVSPHSPP
jgi:hypothetical protein